VTVYNGIKVVMGGKRIDEKMIMIAVEKSGLFLKNWRYRVIGLKGKSWCFGDRCFCVFGKVVV
uniref:hypothetical protein n=1 Tax=Staphylococcus epidermidis TaxID=1282 RepID=UPI001C930704